MLLTESCDWHVLVFSVLSGGHAYVGTACEQMLRDLSRKSALAALVGQFTYWRSNMKLYTRTLMQVLCLFSIALVLPAHILPQYHMPPAAESKKVVDAVSGMFLSLQNDDFAKFDVVTEPNLIIFDAGAKFTRDSMFSLIKEQHAAGKRIVWTVTEPDVHISGDTAWIDYVNVGVLTTGSGDKALTWLESAFLQRKNGQWKIEFLHSTLTPEKAHAKSGSQ